MKERVRREIARNARISNAEIGRRLGLSRERVRQLRAALHLPSRRTLIRREVARLLARGLSGRAVARKRGVSSVAAVIRRMRR